jgi:hypothetical protein
MVFLLPCATALAQGYDDPRVTDYAATLAGITTTQHQILALRAKYCAAGAAQFCQPMQFRPLPSVEEFRQRLPTK